MDKNNFTKNPFVSIIIPIFNSVATIRQCLDSVSKQTYAKERYEIVVIDDGSTDGSSDCVLEYQVILIKQSNKGPACARNRGVKCAKGELVIFLDSDCVVASDWIQKHVNVHVSGCDEGVRLGCVGGSMILPKKHNTIIELSDYYSSWYEPPLASAKQKYEYLPSTNLSILKNVFEMVGGFNENLRCGEDVEFGMRLLGRGYVIKCCPEIEVEHYSRTTLSSFMSHHYQWGYYAPQFRKFGSGLKYDWLFYPNRLYTFAMIPAIAIGYTVFVMVKWLQKGKFMVLILLPMILLSKVSFCFGVLDFNSK